MCRLGCGQRIKANVGFRSVGIKIMGMLPLNCRLNFISFSAHNSSDTNGQDMNDDFHAGLLVIAKDDRFGPVLTFLPSLP